jgi:hypothetical protein
MAQKCLRRTQTCIDLSSGIILNIGCHFEAEGVHFSSTTKASALLNRTPRLAWWSEKKYDDEVSWVGGI